MDGSNHPAVRTTCPYCGVGCGVLATPTGRTSLRVEGDPDHPANFGKLCSKGGALAETMGLAGRLLYPEIAGERVPWDRAIAKIADGFAAAIRDHGPDSVAFYVSGQILTEDYYVANKLMKGFIGSANIDTNSRLCMASSVAGHKRAFGSDTVPGTYEDLELADLVILVGSNLAWCHPILYQRLAAARQRRGTNVVVVDPRRTASCDIADLHLAIRPQTDVELFNGLFRDLDGRACRDEVFIANHTAGVDTVRSATDEMTMARTAEVCGLSERDLATFYDLFARTDRTVTVYSQGVNQAANGTDKVNAILNCHLLTGRVGKPGASPFSVTGQPNAMGGREVGGLSNQLAAHMEIGNREHEERVQRFWASPRMATKPGLKAVDLFDAVAEGRIKALWIMATNPVVSLPNADRVKRGLADCPLVVVSDIVRDTDTARLADVLLPSTGWGEKDGTVTNSERRISRQRAVLPPPGEARHDWQQLCDVASAMGWAAPFAYGSPAQIFVEYAALTAFENDGTRDLDLGGLAHLSATDYDTLAPTQWPIPAGRSSRARIFDDGRFYTDDARARFIASAAPAPQADDGFVLNTGRIRDHWHTLTRTGRAPRLWRHIAEPFVEVHPEDALKIGVRDADLARLSNALGDVIARVVVTDRTPKGSVFVPMHWTGEVSSHGRVDALVAPVTDPISGQPASKASRVEIERYKAKWYGFVAGVSVLLPSRGYWAKSVIEGGAQCEWAGKGPVPTRDEIVALIGYAPEQGDVLAMFDGATKHRIAVFENDRLVGAAFFDREPVAVSRAWLTGLIGTEMDEADRLSVLAGRPGKDRPDPGPTVCSCMNVGANEIMAACRGGALSVEAVAACTGAGTNCGSCRPEIARMLEAEDAA
ncbi:molybdopterin-dependent oxidoreductase [Parvularcula sp. LCG005]|uniref:nitrate reductase n=1 Tax=Parvularcula sp. LCG005 TaxID=3078805 RepID=UPI002943DACC|nr:molybdopterin-dependent oxidoreductase [Parvularcula sp. LCG005]WOI52200.1 molybdopterin-dependent oxidoreductase [Parvularcula sp. LCG005]